MFDFGFWELAIVGIVALVVVGPDKLPALAVKLGRFLGKLRRYFASVRADIESELKSAELKEMLEKQQSEISELRSILSDAKTNVERDVKDLGEPTLADAVAEEINKPTSPAASATDKAEQ
jgi:sec-independent protein translocase protein TatB|tara:strand:- start:3818 stop:4180 length:363 start_codon:yes stop_codon:yes gene_type:complete